MIREQKKKPKPKVEKVEEPAPEVTATASVSKEDTEALLDDIDALLEEHAEDFVRAYIQRGGQ